MQHPPMCPCAQCVVDRAVKNRSALPIPFAKPLGKRNESGGGLKINIGIDKSKNAVIFSFGTRISFLGMSKANAKEVARVILEQADKLEE